ncbi:hypothetical protein [Mycobacterium haemophilum]|uniref:hypothetical protein n=1 Tax=Mycobacterium haemophilum TaxID=29311 RepID=UPI001E605B21|nr:hypothetical protein [Mycobacterium haemophilum]
MAASSHLSDLAFSFQRLPGLYSSGCVISLAVEVLREGGMVSFSMLMTVVVRSQATGLVA